MFSIDEIDDDIKNIADDIFNKVQDILPYEQIRVVIKKRDSKSMKASGYDYEIITIVKVEELSAFRNYGGRKDLKINIEKIVNDSKKRFKLPVKTVISTGIYCDSWVYSYSYRNNEIISKTYDKNIIYDLKSDTYKEL